MTLETARETAQFRANQTGNIFVIHRACNGQWMYASLDWWQRNAKPGSPAEIFKPEGGGK